MTILSLLAEKVNRYVSGILMMFPSTIVLGFFFLGISNSPQAVSRIIPTTLVPLGILVLSTLVYIRLARIFSKTYMSKAGQICATFISASIIWFALVTPFAIWKFDNLMIGIVGYLFSLILARYFFARIQRVEFPIKIIYNKKQIFFRAAFMGLVISVIVFMSKILNPFWGGVFTMYPAATFSALMVMHYYYHPDQLYHFYVNAPIGSLSLFVYCISVLIFFPLLGTVLGTLSAYSVCLFFSLVLIKVQKYSHANTSTM
jgi:hypothetical protein